MARAGAKPQLVTASPQINPELVDQYVDLYSKMAAWRPNLNPHAAPFERVKAEILAFYENHPAKEPAIAEGKRYRVPVTPRQVKRWPINVLGFFRKVGKDAYLQMCQPGLGQIEHMIEKDRLDLYIASSQTGPRRLGEPVEQDVSEVRSAA